MSYQQINTNRGGTIATQDGVIKEAWLSSCMAFPLTDMEKHLSISAVTEIIDNYVLKNMCRCTRCCKDMSLTNIAQRESFAGVICSDCVPAFRADLVNDSNCHLCGNPRSYCCC